MPRKLEVELTSARDDGSWTWRAAGAREPRGVLDGGLLPDGSKTGDVLVAEADFDLDGVSIVSVTPKQAKRRNEAERIEILGRPQRDDQLVTSSVTSRPGGERGNRRDRGARPGRRERPSRDRERTKERGERPPRTAERRPPRAR